MFSFFRISYRQTPVLSSKRETENDLIGAVPDKNEVIIRGYFQKVWNEADLKVVEEVTPEPFVLHFEGEPVVANHKEHQDVVQYWLNGFPDYQVQIQDVITEGNKVVARYIHRDRSG